MKDTNSSNPHIGIIYPSFLPDTQLLSGLNKLKVSDIKIDVQKRDPEPWASTAWAVPTLVIAYIFKSYFDGFLKEAGKDHYSMLKHWLSVFVYQNRFSTKMLVSDQSPEKINGGDKMSKSVSLVIQTKTGRRIKLLFDDTLDQKDWEEAIEILFDCVFEDYETTKESKLRLLTKNLVQHPNFEYYAVVDADSKELIIYDDHDLVRMNKEKKIS